MNDILEGLNEQQQLAVKTIEGPVLILAGAGSGKTKALTHRIAYLICEKKVHPQNILAVTFTNKASEEMKKRINNLLSSNVSNLSSVLPWMGTFHSICVKILRREIESLGYRPSFTIYDEDDSLAAIKQAMTDAGIDKKQYNPKAIKNFISGAKNELIDSRSYAKYAQGHFGAVVLRVYEQYQKELKNANALDFDDLIMKTVELFESFPEILVRWQEIFHYILIDEYQDTNRAQYRLVQLLAQKYQNICVVGDDFQSIYSFRGANFKNILDFEKDYPKAQVIKMEQNYRSTKNIISAAQKVIEKNIFKSQKSLWTENEKGLPTTLFEATNETDEVEFILDEIEALKHLGPYNQFVILYRTNAQSRIFEEVLLQRNIPYRLIGAFRFYERKEVKDILAYLRLILNPLDKVSLKRIINVPPRGIGKMTNYEVRNTKTEKFFQMMDELRVASEELRVDELIDEITNRTDYQNYITDACPELGRRSTEEGEMRWENIKELKSVAQQSEGLAGFLEKVSLVSEVDNLDQNADAVTLMTLHNAKGLEFPIVFIAGMEEGLFPYSRSLSESSQLEEERRLCYVGMTRARKRLYLSYASSRMIFGSQNFNQPSRFIADIPDGLIERI